MKLVLMRILSNGRHRVSIGQCFQCQDQLTFSRIVGKKGPHENFQTAQAVAKTKGFSLQPDRGAPSPWKAHTQLIEHGEDKLVSTCSLHFCVLVTLVQKGTILLNIFMEHTVFLNMKCLYFSWFHSILVYIRLFLIKNAAMNLGVQICLQCTDHISFDMHTVVVLLGNSVFEHFVTLGRSILFTIMDIPIYICINSAPGCSSPHPCQHMPLIIL